MKVVYDRETDTLTIIFADTDSYTRKSEKMLMIHTD